MKTILLAEDDPNDVEMTLAALEEYNLANEVEVVNDGAEALDFIHCRGNYAGREPSHPALVLLDIKMPRVDGIEVLREIKANPDCHCIPVVMMTSSREERDMVESYELGANAYVVKPVDFHAFVDAVKQLTLFWVILNEPPPNCRGGKRSEPRSDSTGKR